MGRIKSYGNSGDVLSQQLILLLIAFFKSLVMLFIPSDPSVGCALCGKKHMKTKINDAGRM